jgi:hypothetical protein
MIPVSCEWISVFQWAGALSARRACWWVACYARYDNITRPIRKRSGCVGREAKPAGDSP